MGNKESTLPGLTMLKYAVVYVLAVYLFNGDHMMIEGTLTLQTPLQIMKVSIEPDKLSVIRRFYR